MLDLKSFLEFAEREVGRMAPDFIDPEVGMPDDLPRSLAFQGETHGLLWSIDSDTGQPYATVGYNLPPRVLAEIEDGTYGQLQGFRIYYDD